MHTHDARPAGYLPAAGHDLFLPLYDPMLRWLMRERAFKTRLVEQADICVGHRVLDLGCGTGTLALMATQMHPGAVVVGVDGDAKVLARARKKVAAAGASIELDEALAGALPYADASFDRVLSSLMLHHLTHAQKLEALGEVRRVLKPAGSFHVVDFGPPSNWLDRLTSHLFAHDHRMEDNLQGRLGEVAAAAGLRDVRDRGSFRTAFGTLAFLSAAK
jgi:ubiquinone/menaquinone biosynthesis C-methylase UbiE